MSEIYLSNERYLAALKRIKGLISAGLILKGQDDGSIGNKSTGCSWGLCMDDKEHWPDSIDYLWPDTPERVVPKYTKVYQACPMDKRENPDGNGCFYTCRFFSRGNNPTLEEALKLYDYRINIISKGMSK